MEPTADAMNMEALATALDESTPQPGTRSVPAAREVALDTPAALAADLTQMHQKAEARHKELMVMLQKAEARAEKAEARADNAEALQKELMEMFRKAEARAEKAEASQKELMEMFKKAEARAEERITELSRELEEARLTAKEGTLGVLLPKELEAAMRDASNMSASAYGKEGWKRFQKNVGGIFPRFIGRPFEAQAGRVMPTELAHPAFLEFCKRFDKARAKPITKLPGSLREKAQQLAEAMCAIYTNEMERRQTLTVRLDALLREEAGFEHTVSCVQEYMVGKGRVDIAFLSAGEPLVFAEVKDAANSNAYMQNVQYAVHRATAATLTPCGSPRAPIFLLQLAEDMFSVAAFWMAGPIPCAQLLTDAFVMSRSFEHATRAIYALFTGMKVLMQAKDTPPSAGVDFPHLPRIRQWKLTFKKRLYGRLAWRVTAQRDVTASGACADDARTDEAADKGLDCVLKLAKRYGYEAHKHAASKGFAPNVYCLERLTDEWVAVLMEYCPWNRLSELPPIDRRQVGEALQAAVDDLHHAGFVHGDLHQGNVLVNTEPGASLDSLRGINCIRIVDWDWAGRAKAVFYPLGMNRAHLVWAPTVMDGGAITPAHDNFLVNRVCAGEGDKPTPRSSLEKLVSATSSHFGDSDAAAASAGGASGAAAMAVP